MTKEEEIKRVHGNGAHVVILGAGASIASTIRNPEKSGRTLPAMNNIVDVVGLKGIVNKLPKEFHVDINDFEKLYSKLTESGLFKYEIELIEESVYDYFKSLKLPEEPTIYDYLILSLRPKDVIATFNWDPFLYQAYGRNGKFNFTQSPGILFLHGNVSIGYSKVEKRGGPARMWSKVSEDYFEPTKLLYPVSRKNYTSDEYLKSQWDALTDHLKYAERVTVFGYRAPESDIEAIKLMQEAWGTPEKRNMEQFELIDIREENEVKKSWDKFIHSHHYSYGKTFFESSLAKHPRRTIESYRHWSMPMTPSDAFQDGNKVPDNFKTLEEMWNWYKPIVDAEKAND
jgi:hypothetical protein